MESVIVHRHTAKIVLFSFFCVYQNTFHIYVKRYIIMQNISHIHISDSCNERKLFVGTFLLEYYSYIIVHCQG